MRKDHKRWRALGFGLGLMLLVALGLPMSATAQLNFTTNTPPPRPTSAPALFATNTPVPIPTLTATPRVPTVPFENYALRLWLEADMIALMSRQISALHTGGIEAQQALRLLQYELQQRFPAAPSNPADLEALLQAMLNAPIGSVDMRPFVHRYIQAELNRLPDAYDLEVGGFLVTVADANLDNASATDAVIRIQYPQRYDEYVLALRTETGSYRIIPSAYDLPAAPFGTLKSVTLQRIADVNRDGLSEVVLVADDGQVNQRLWIIGYRNGQALELTAPNQEIRFAEIVSWDLLSESRDVPPLRVLGYRAESAAPNWICNSSLPITWSWQGNFYRPSTDPNQSYQIEPSLGCTLYQAEPLFALDPAEAIHLIETALIEYSLDDPSGRRALMVMAMLYAMNGQVDIAQATARALLAGSPEGSWGFEQATALIEATNIPSNTALDVCEALARASRQAPACDVDGVIERYLGFIELTTSDDLTAQLRRSGFPIAESLIVSEIGRADRIGVRFDVIGASWWGFVAQRDGTYQAERIAPPYVTADAALTELLPPPDRVYTLLFRENNPNAALALIETAQNENRGRSLSPEALYVRALSYDLAANRNAARQAYYELWRTYPQSLWGQLAADHLEARN